MIKEFFKDLTQARTLKFSVLDTLKWMITNLETRKRILITMGAIVILQVAAFIPLPGIDISVLQELFHRISRTQSGLLIGMIQLFSGGALDRLRIFALGLMPFFSACLLLQLTTIFIPKLSRYSFC
jgi:preprotein translocase subunit SecY